MTWISRSISRIREARADNRALHGKVEGSGERVRWTTRIEKNNSAIRHELWKLGAAGSGLALVLGALGWVAYRRYHPALADLQPAQVSGTSAVPHLPVAPANKIRQIRSLVRSLGGSIVHESENLLKFRQFAIVFPMYHLEAAGVPSEPMIRQARTMVRMVEVAGIQDVLAEGYFYGEPVPRIRRMLGTEDQILRAVLVDFQSPPDVALSVLLRDVVRIHGIEDRDLYMKNGAVELFDSHMGNYPRLRIASTPDDVREGVNAATRAYCAEHKVDCTVTGVTKMVVVPIIPAARVQELDDFAHKEIDRLIVARSMAFIRHCQAILREQRATFAQLQIGGAHLNPTVEQLEKNGIGIMVVSNPGINRFIRATFPDEPLIPDYLKRELK